MAKSRISRQAISRLKQKLLDRKAYLADEIRSRMEEAGSTGDDRLTDLMDQATDAFEDEMAMSLATQERDELVAIGEALNQMAEGTYGVCTACGKAIGVKRLEVIPFSTMCITCKRKQELGLDLET